MRPLLKTVVPAFCRAFLCVLALGTVGAVPPSAPASFPARLERVRKLIEDGYYDRASPAARALLRETEASTGADSLQAADAIEVLVRALDVNDEGMKPEATALANRGLAVRERLLGPDDPAVATMLDALANILDFREDYKGAAAASRRAQGIRDRARGRGDARMAEGLLNTASMLQDTEDYEEALALAERALKISQDTAGSESLPAGRALKVIGSIKENLADYKAAREILERALKMHESFLRPDHPELARCLRTLGFVYVRLGDYSTARQHLERSAKILEISQPGSLSMSYTLNNLGAARAETGDLQGALTALTRSLSIVEKRLGAGSTGTALTCDRLGLTYMMAGDFVRAKQFMERALAIYERFYGPDDSATIDELNNLGFLLLNMGEYAAARPHLERAYAGAKKAEGDNTPQYADVISSLADLELLTGSLPRAKAIYEEAQAVRLAYYGPDHLVTAHSLTSLARVDLLTGRPSATMEKALRAEAIARRDFQAVARSLSERQALGYEAIRISGLDLALSALEEMKSTLRGAAETRRVWDALVRSRAMVLDEMATRHRAVMDIKSETARGLLENLAQARERLARLTTGGPGSPTDATYPVRLKAAQSDEEQAEQALAEVSNDFRAIHQRKEAGLEEVARSLPEGAVLIGYVSYTHLRRPKSGASEVVAISAPGSRAELRQRGNEIYAAFAIQTGGGGPVFVPLGPAERIDAAIRDWRKESSAPQAALALRDDPAELRNRAAGVRLRRLVWDPVASRFASARRVFIVPDGGLNLVSFTALAMDDGRYLAETGLTLHYLSAERDAIARPGASVKGHGLLALGGPDFEAEAGAVAAASSSAPPRAEHARSVDVRGAQADCSDLRSIRFTPLPAARAEVEELAALWQKSLGDGRRSEADVRALVGAAASEAALKAGVPGPRVVHLATHGYVSGGNCVSSLGSLSGARVALAEQDMLGVIGDNPLLLAGLALAGANRRARAGPDQEDGILTGEEIGALDFTGTDWVVLSACETGVGEVRAGEGLLGLRRAFETSGAGTLIMSLWPVEDDATRQWMRALYEARLAGQSTADSVRRADLSVIEARRKAGKSTHPFFWGAFVAAGDWR